MVGEKRRREHLREKNSDLEELHKKVIILEETNEKLEDENLGYVIENCELKKKLTKLEVDKNDQFSWVKILWKNCNPDVKKEIKAAVQASKEEFPKGVIKGIRDQAGINFSNPLSVSQPTRSTGDLKEKIEAFAIRNSFEVPDKKMAKKKIRYMRHWKIVLHQQFLMENPGVDCHYTSFCAHFPSNIIKPGINSHGSCLCEDCENFSLKIEALKRSNLLKEDNIEDIIKSNREGNSTPEAEFLKALEDIKKGDRKDDVISYFVWKDDKQQVVGENGVTTTKKMTRKNYQVTVSTLIDRIEETFGPLKQHLHRDNVIKKFIRDIRIKAMDDSSLVCLTVDWSENGTLIIPGEVQTAFFGRASYSIHSGYLYQKDNCHGFAMLTDENNHKAESIWAAITPTMEVLVLQGVRIFYICSDSTGAQYRNCKNAFFIRNFAMKFNVTVVWIFTEKHHGKSPADGIGGNVKNQVEQLTAFSTEHNVRNAEDVATLLGSTDTSIKVSHFTKEDIEKTLAIIPGELNSLKGATKYHEIFVNPVGKIMVKELPTDDNYNTVNITVKRRRQLNRGGIEAPVARIDDNPDNACSISSTVSGSSPVSAMPTFAGLSNSTSSSNSDTPTLAGSSSVSARTTSAGLSNSISGSESGSPTVSGSAPVSARSTSADLSNFPSSSDSDPPTLSSSSPVSTSAGLSNSILSSGSGSQTVSGRSGRSSRLSKRKKQPVRGGENAA